MIFSYSFLNPLEIGKNNTSSDSEESEKPKKKKKKKAKKKTVKINDDPKTTWKV